MDNPTRPTPAGVEELTNTECEALFAAATRALGYTPTEFENKWRSGSFADDPDPQVTRVAMLMPRPW